MKILFISANRIGDAVLTTGVLDHLVSTFADARLTVACGPLAAPLFTAAPGVERVIVMPKRRFAGHWLSLWRQVVGTRWDLVVDLRDSVVGRLVAARRRLILSGRSAATAGEGVHKVETLARLVGATPPPSPRVWLNDEARNAARSLLEPIVGASDGVRPRLLALAPTANWIGKEWPASRFVDAATTLTAAEGPLAGGAVMVLAAPAERPRAALVVEGLTAALGEGRVIDLIGRTDALTAAACLARADLLIGNDSGLAHIGAAVGAPTLGLFGPGFPEIYGPRGRWTAVVTSLEPGETLRERVRRDGADSGLMDGIAVPAVVAAASALLDRRTGERD